MRWAWIAPLIAIAGLTGCGDLPSLEALATDQNIVFDPSLVGAWHSSDAVVIVQAGDDRSYRINWMATDTSDTPQVVRMEGRLAKVGDQRILDLMSSEPGAFSIPCHVFLRVRPAPDGLKVQFVDSKWIREQVKTNSLATFMFENDPVLAVPTPQLEAFLLKYGFDERALDDPLMLRPLRQN